VYYETKLYTLTNLYTMTELYIFTKLYAIADRAVTKPDDLSKRHLPARHVVMNGPVERLKIEPTNHILCIMPPSQQSLRFRTIKTPPPPILLPPPLINLCIRIIPLNQLPRPHPLLFHPLSPFPSTQSTLILQSTLPTNITRDRIKHLMSPPAFGRETK